MLKLGRVYRILLWATLFAAAATCPFAQAVKRQADNLDQLGYAVPEIRLTAQHQDLSEVRSLVDPSMLSDFEAFSQAEGQGLWTMVYDRITGNPAHMEGKGVPWIPGSANRLAGADFGLPAGVGGDEIPVGLVSEKALDLLKRYPRLFGIDPADLVLRKDASGPVLDYLYYIDFDWTYRGIAVEKAHVVFRLNSGNLVQMGQEYISAAIRQLDTDPSLDVKRAWAIMWDYVKGQQPGDLPLGPARLTIIPISRPEALSGTAVNLGEGLAYRLVYTLAFRRPGVVGTWEARVDAHTGEVISFLDSNRYGKIHGGAYASDQPAPEVDRPLPYADVSGSYASAAGLYPCEEGIAAASSLSGDFVRIQDTCGSIYLEKTDCDIDFGSSPDTDCSTPGFGGSGNTRAARTQYYNISLIKAKAMAYLPANLWLQGQLLDRVNVIDTCNAYWSGSSIVFFRSGGGCANTGELPGISLHEFGHGLDSYDGTSPVDKGTGETYGDFTASLQTHSSCVGAGFHGYDCVGYSNGCTGCTGIRDIDYAKHTNPLPNFPEDITSNTCPGCTTWYCYTSTYDGPCGYEGHCESAVSSQALWDLATRDLTAWGLDQATAWQVTDRLWYASRPTSGAAYACPTLIGSNGCGTSNFFTVLRVADDCDGDLSNGTPHAGAIYAAFARHKIACDSVNNADQAGCCPAYDPSASTLSALPGNNSASLSWEPVTGASSYLVLRNEAGCDAGFTRIAEVSSPGLAYTDTSLVNGMAYYFALQGVGPSAACTTALSNCISVIPQPCNGSVMLGSPLYRCSDTVPVAVTDSNIPGAPPSIQVGAWSTTDPNQKTFTLSNDPVGSPSYLGAIALTAGSAGPGEVQVADGDTLTVRYIDADYCTAPGVPVDAMASVDCVGPVISNVRVASILGNSVTIAWDTDGPANSIVSYANAQPLAGSAGSQDIFTTSHSVTLTGLYNCSRYLFSVSSSDAAGNLTIDDNGGAFYTFTTQARVYLLYDNAEGGSGPWTVSGTNSAWHLDTCRSYSASHSWKAGANDAPTCSAVYTNYIQTTLTSGNISLGESGNAFGLRWKEWYFTEPGYDFCRVQISANGGSTWSDLVTQYSGQSQGWIEKEIPLSSYSGTVKLRFYFYSDAYIADEGWYIDDIEVSAISQSSCPSSDGSVAIGQDRYGCSDMVSVSLKDADLVGTGTHQVHLATGSEPSGEDLSLSEDPPYSGIFSGVLALGAPPPAGGDAILSITDGETVAATYIDADDGQGNTGVQKIDTAIADCMGPSITDVQITGVTIDSATVTWTTDEPSNSSVTYGLSSPPGQMAQDLTTYGTTHSIGLTGLSSCARYYLEVASTDMLGNSTADSAGGAYYRFKTIGMQQLFYEDAERGVGQWLISGTGSAWHIDSCRSVSSERSWKAGANDSPQCAATYANSTSAYLTSPAIGLGDSGHGFHLRWNEWYITNNYYDYCYVQISTDGGGTWTQLASRTGNSNGWVQRDVDLAAHTGTALLRFYFTSYSYTTYEGWYIDDIEVTRPSALGCPSRDGWVRLENDLYGCSSTLHISLWDEDMAGSEAQGIELYSTTEPAPESAVVWENPPNSGKFAGTFDTAQVPPTQGDSFLSCLHGDTITARYLDYDDGNGHANVIKSDTASVHCLGPVISNITVTGVTQTSATVSWATDEPANSSLLYGSRRPPATERGPLEIYSTNHSIKLDDLAPCTLYFFQVTSADWYGNPTTDNGDGGFLFFVTSGEGFAFGPDDAESGIGGWTATGEWHLDTCRYSSGAHSWKAGSKLCPGGTKTYTTSTLSSQSMVLGPSGHGYHLKYREWYDLGNGGDTYIRISTNGGSSWTTIQYDYDRGQSGGWVQRDLDLSAYTGSTVKIRFELYSSSAIAEGWYLDDISVVRAVPCEIELQYNDHSLTDICNGNGAGSLNGILDPGEDATLEIVLANLGTQGATGVVATIATGTPGITITSGTALFPPVAAGSAESSLPGHFSFRVGDSVACGSAIAFSLHVSSSENQVGWDDTFSLQVGQSLPGGGILLSESFDSPTFPPPGWESVRLTGESCAWARVTTSSHPTGATPPSGAGMAFFNSYLSAAGESSRLQRQVGIPIPSSSTSATLSFYMYHDNEYTANNDSVQPQVSISGLTWTDLGGPIYRYSGTAGWALHQVSLNAYIGISNLLVGLKGVSAYGNDCYIDEVRISYTSSPACVFNPCTPNCSPPGSPVITQITDHDTCAQNGVRIFYSPGSGAVRHDLCRDGVSVATGYLSGLLHNPSDGEPHSYAVRAVSGNCFMNSQHEYFTDETLPAEPTVSGYTSNQCPATSVYLYTEQGMSAYQWYSDGEAIPGATGSGYTATIAGSYSVSYSNAGGCQAGTSQELVVSIVPCPEPQEVAPGDLPTNAQGWEGKDNHTWPAVSNASGYVLISGTRVDLQALLDGRTDSCTTYKGQSLSASTSWDQPASLPSGDFFWYLVIAFNPNGYGTAGGATSGERAVNRCGSCVPAVIRCPALGTDSPDWPSSHGSQAGRINLNSTPSSCAGKTCPSRYDSYSRQYDAYSFDSDGSAPKCVTVRVISHCGSSLCSASYASPFDPSQICNNYMGDPGSNMATQQHSITVQPESVFTVVVSPYYEGGNCPGGYDLEITGLCD